MKEATEPTAPVKNEPTKDNPPLTNRSGWRTTVNKEEAIDENALIRAVGTALARNAESLATINDLRLRIVEGDVLDKEKVDEIVKG